jgi:molecular chaperone HscB
MATADAARDPFAVMGVPRRFDVDLPALDERRKELSRALHPDRFASSPAAERRLALGRAIEVNEAFRALKDPIKRAEALARAIGLAVGETTEPKPSPDLLMEMMEAREELAEAGRARDSKKLAALGRSMAERERSIVATLATAFADEARREEILPKLGELRYIRRFLDEVAAFEELAMTS